MRHSQSAGRLHHAPQVKEQQFLKLLRRSGAATASALSKEIDALA